MPTLKKDETIILETKPHWISIFLPFLIALISVVIGAYMQGYFFIIPLLSSAFLCYKIAELNAHVWLITNLRIIDESGIFSRQSQECPLDKVTNVSCSQTLWGRVFRFGDVEIQTASDGALQYVNVLQPRAFADTILQMQEEYKGSQLRQQAQKLAQAMNNNPTKQNNGDKNATYSAPISPKMASYLELEKLHELYQKGILTEQEYLEQKRKILNN